MRFKRALAAALALFTLLALSACGPRARKGTVYWLNDDLSRNAAALALADRYEKESGVTVRVITPGEKEYETRLASEMRRKDAPTLFSVRGEDALADWQPSCLDLRSADVYAALRPDGWLLRGENETVYGIGHDVASFGLIVNTALLSRAGYRPEEIDSFDALRRASEDIQARSDALGFAAFAAAGLASDSSPRFTRQLFSVAVSLEYADRPAAAGEPIRGTYMGNYRSLLDLCLDNSTRPARTELSELGLAEARAEFTAGRAVFYQGDSGELPALLAAGMKAEELTMLPLYMGGGNEESQGLCTDAAGYWCVNQNAAAENLQATLDFLAWCSRDAEAAQTLGVERSFFDSGESADPFVRSDSALTLAGRTPLAWNLDILPDDRWEKEAARMLADYALSRDNESWEAVRGALVDAWAERAGRYSN